MFLQSNEDHPPQKGASGQYDTASMYFAAITCNRVFRNIHIKNQGPDVLMLPRTSPALLDVSALYYHRQKQ